MNRIPNWVKYDEQRDELVLHGIRYSAPLFESLGALEVGSTLRIVRREDGVLTLERVAGAAHPKHPASQLIVLLRELADGLESRRMHAERYDAEFEPRYTTISADDLRLNRPAKSPDYTRVKLKLDVYAWPR